MVTLPLCVCRLKKKLPGGRAFVCMDNAELPQILQQIFMSHPQVTAQELCTRVIDTLFIAIIMYDRICVQLIWNYLYYKFELQLRR